MNGDDFYREQARPEVKYPLWWRIKDFTIRALFISAFVVGFALFLGLVYFLGHVRFVIKL
jgi:hypothetical protein